MKAKKTCVGWGSTPLDTKIKSQPTIYSNKGPAIADQYSNDRLRPNGCNGMAEAGGSAREVNG